MPSLQESMPLLSLADAKQLMDMCQQGRLYEIEEWIAAGKSLHVLRCSPKFGPGNKV